MNLCTAGDEDALLDDNDTSINTAENFEPADAAAASSPRRHSGQQGTRMIGTIFLIVNATLGAGLLNFPQAFDKAGGIASASIVQLAFLAFITGALVILAHCSDITNTSNMQDTLAGLCGHTALIVCGLCVAVYSFGCCLTFLIVVGDQFDRVLATNYGMDYCNIWYLSRNFVTVTTCCVFILPLCFFKRLEVLSYASSIGCLAIVYLIFIVVRENVINEDDDKPKPTQTWPDDVVQGMQIVPIICFAYQSHMTAIPTYSCMKKRKLVDFTICSMLGMSICFFAYTLVGAFGYTSFGMGQVPEDILQGYTDTGLAVTAAIIAVAVKNFVTYPIVLFCGRDALLGLLNVADTRNNNSLRMLVTFLWFGLSLLIAILVPDIGPVINLMGTLSAIFIFIFPGICLLQSTLLRNPTFNSNKDRLLVFLAILIIALGTFVCGFIFVQTIEDITAKKPFEPPLVTFFRSNIRKSLCL